MLKILWQWQSSQLLSLRCFVFDSNSVNNTSYRHSETIISGTFTSVEEMKIRPVVFLYWFSVSLGGFPYKAVVNHSQLTSPGVSDFLNPLIKERQLWMECHFLCGNSYCASNFSSTARLDRVLGALWSFHYAAAHLCSNCAEVSRLSTTRELTCVYTLLSDSTRLSR